MPIDKGIMHIFLYVAGQFNTQPTVHFLIYVWKSARNHYILTLCIFPSLFIAVVQKIVKQLPHKHRVLLSGIVAFVVLLMLLPGERANASKNAQILEVGKRYELPVNIDVNESNFADLVEDDLLWQTVRVAKGDTLAKIFQKQGLTPQETYRISRAGDDAKKLVSLKPGETLSLLKDVQGNLTHLRYPLNATDTLVISKQDDKSYVSRIDKKQIETQLNFAQGEIESSFWNAGIKAQLTESQIMSLAGIFGWDIDFALELRQGDTFNVVFEENYVDGEFVGFGNIVAAEFVNQGESFTAIRYEDGNYYSPDGRSMRKSFLRAPVNFKYISSNFKKSRYHPVQKRWKAHRGVDYAANTGTPVMAAGDGRVIRATYDKYNGHHVFIQHGEKYVTKYLHFSKRAVKKGQTVKQGQIIGYVGATGLAAGPHLHYEFLVDGVHRNPRTVTLPKAKPIADKDRDAFTAIAQVRLEQLNTTRRIMLAMN